MWHRSLGFGRLLQLLAGIVWACGLVSCDSESDQKEPDKELVGLLELPLSHRNSDKLSGSVTRVEIGPTEIRAGGETILSLTGGKVADKDRKGPLLPALKESLGNQPALALVVYSATPYATLASVIHTGLESGARELFFRVRKPAATTEAGWMRLHQVQMTAELEPPVFDPGDMPDWDAFTKVWAQASAGCREDPRGDCGYVPSLKAKGGKLEMLLKARGTGITVRFRQYLEETAEEPKSAPKKAAAPQMLDGIAAAPAPVAEEEEEPATEAMFTLRADQAARPASAFSSIVQAVCSDLDCAAVVDSEDTTLSARVLSMIGAAFPDGTPAPQLAFRLPEG